MLPAALFAAALTTVALDDVLMVLPVAIALMLVGIFVYVVYARALATRSRAYPVTRWRHRFRVMWLTNGTSTVGVQPQTTPPDRRAVLQARRSSANRFHLRDHLSFFAECASHSR
ncbi:hypothetical protein W59_10579 [Rhodococcus opacus RKJ300 = JCM 13270]|uniref:Uncharacterized protein n=2 Tax=Nocardiaceae TaxID=85025 RepID=I0WU81_RHOOP|nr:hypothetical protein [Rhodococcus opacus]EID79947.1 hypothetical protein W59_10579 [Rhodococcus opacus RKJ300 = JCM 13270]